MKGHDVTGMLGLTFRGLWSQ